MEPRLDAILKKVSRSFYLTLRAVPRRLREPLGLAYLFCRAADTIADTDLIPAAERLDLLSLFRDLFSRRPISGEPISEIRRRMISGCGSSGEQALLNHLEDGFRFFERLSEEDQNRIRFVVTAVTHGMEMDLSFFTSDPDGAVRALPSERELDRYCYCVAGAVGEFWTEMLTAHVPSSARWDRKRMSDLGVEFGKGLQMTNILRDIPADLTRGRCYLPETLLSKYGLAPHDLKDPASADRFRPLLSALVSSTQNYLSQGFRYIMSIPRRQVRLRLACLWQHLFAVKTLRRILDHPADLLSPGGSLKISRREVYTVMLLSTAMVYSNRLLTRYYSSLRREGI
jgi:farnesyl-diphosphate farnesyltransferase